MFDHQIAQAREQSAFDDLYGKAPGLGFHLALDARKARARREREIRNAELDASRQQVREAWRLYDAGLGPRP